MLRGFADRISPIYIALAIAATVLVIYLPHVGHAFVSFDDGVLIYSNPAVQEFTPRAIKYIFTSYDPELYVPLTLLTYQIEHALFGLAPWIYHLTNILLHAANAALVFAIVTALAGRRSVGVIAGFLFAVHPLHTEAVLWAAARKDVLSAFFFLLSIGLYLQYCRTSRKKFSALSIMSFALGLLAKVSIITFPIVLLLIDWKRGRTGWRKLLFEKWPYFALSILFGIIAIYGKTTVLSASSPMQTALLALKSTTFYVLKIFVPIQLSVIYPQETPVTLTSIEFLVPLLIALGLIGTAIASAKRHRDITFWIAFFFLMLLPNYTNFWKNGFLFFASDRYAYLPSIGILALIAAAVIALHSRVRMQVMSVGVGIVVIALGTLASLQGRTWENSESLYRNVLALYPSSAMAHNNLGDILLKSGRPTEAGREFATAISLDPDLVQAHLNQGNLLREKGDTEGAIAEYELAIAAIGKKHVLSAEDLAGYYFLGEFYDSLGKTEEAIAQFKAAVERGPQFPDAHYNLGVTYYKHGKLEEAEAAFKAAIEVHDGYAETYYNLAAIEAETGRIEQAMAHLETVLKLDPYHVKAREHLETMRGMQR
ncbi:MAG: tetratricopeptide repeat protein [Candidatus Peregrinibacteria bacterium]|nr:tetratricopeptide repeat protein [Candidatus Peregrinibacteria bacterium]